jgi:hypothetical protein
MAPVPDPEPTPFHPLAVVKDNWDSISPVLHGYNTILGALGSVFAFASAIALIVQHGQPPKWPFTKERWNPRPSIKEPNKTEEVTDEQLIEDELAEVAGAVRKRALLVKWLDDGTRTLEKREGISLINVFGYWFIGSLIDEIQDRPEEVVEKAKNATGEVIKEAKTGLESIGEELKDIWNTAEEVGRDLLDDIKEIFEGDHKAKGAQKPNVKVPDELQTSENSTETGNSTQQASPTPGQARLF